MSEQRFLDQEGVLYLWAKIKELIAEANIPEGSTVVDVDNASIEEINGVLSLYGFTGAAPGQLPRIGTDGTIEWFTPDTETVPEDIRIIYGGDAFGTD